MKRVVVIMMVISTHLMGNYGIRIARCYLHFKNRIGILQRKECLSSEETIKINTIEAWLDKNFPLIENPDQIKNNTAGFSYYRFLVISEIIKELEEQYGLSTPQFLPQFQSLSRLIPLLLDLP